MGSPPHLRSTLFVQLWHTELSVRSFRTNTHQLTVSRQDSDIRRPFRHRARSQVSSRLSRLRGACARSAASLSQLWEPSSLNAQVFSSCWKNIRDTFAFIFLVCLRGVRNEPHVRPWLCRRAIFSGDACDGRSVRGR